MGGSLKENSQENQPQGMYPKGKGRTTIAPEVLLTITRLAATQVPGVSRFSSVPGSVDRLFSSGYSEGVQLNVRDDVVYADLYLVIQSGFNIRDVSRQVQRSIARSISEMAGMQVGRVNIHVEDIDYQTEPVASPPEEV